MEAGYCKQRVRRGFNVSNCSKNAVRDGYCAQHHPDAVAKRRAARDERWNLQAQARKLSENVREAEDRVLRAAEQWLADESEVSLTLLRADLRALRAARAEKEASKRVQ